MELNNNLPLIDTLLQIGPYILAIGLAWIVLNIVFRLARRVIGLGCFLIVLLGVILVSYRLLG